MEVLQCTDHSLLSVKGRLGYEKNLPHRFTPVLQDMFLVLITNVSQRSLYYVQTFIAAN